MRSPRREGSGPLLAAGGRRRRSGRQIERPQLAGELPLAQLVLKNNIEFRHFVHGLQNRSASRNFVVIFQFCTRLKSFEGK